MTVGRLGPTGGSFCIVLYIIRFKNKPNVAKCTYVSSFRSFFKYRIKKLIRLDQLLSIFSILVIFI